MANLQIDYRLIFALMNGKVSSALRRRLNNDFHSARIGISGEQWDVLVALSQDAPCTQQALCNATSLSKPTISRMIGELEKRGIVERERDQTDHRNNHVQLTTKGLRIVEKGQAIAVGILKKSLRSLSKMDIIISQRSLNIVLHNIQEEEHNLSLLQRQKREGKKEASRHSVRRLYQTNDFKLDQFKKKKTKGNTLKTNKNT